MTVTVTVDAPDHASHGHVDTVHLSPMRAHIGLVWAMSKKNFQVRYKRAVLGVLWAVVQPSFQAAFLTFIFLYVFHYGRTIPHYPLYVLSGMLPWAFFTQGVAVATGAVVENAALVRKVAVPRVIFPISAVGGVALAFLASVAILVVAAFLSGTVSTALLLLPLAIVIETFVIVALGVLACAFHVAFRDVKYIVESALLIGLYATPVLYDLHRMPHLAQQVIRTNPMTGAMSLYRAAVLGQPLDRPAVILGVIVSGVLLAVALAVFAHRSDEFPDLV